MPDLDPAVIVALVAALPGLYATFQQRKKLDAEATAKVAEAAIGLVDDYREDNQQLRVQLRDKEIERQVLHETLMSCIARNKLNESEIARMRKRIKELEGDGTVTGRDVNGDDSDDE